MKIGHVNILSVKRKYSQLHNLLEFHKYGIFCVTETLLKENHELLKLHNYIFLRNDITTKGQRGVGIFVHNDILAKTVIFSIENNNIEAQIIKIQINKTKSMLVGCIYRHPKYTAHVIKQDIDSLIELFNHMLTFKLTFYILGDFNLKNNYVKPLLDYTQSIGVKQLITIPTRLNNILDLIFTNDNRSIQTNVFDGSLADHCITDITINSSKIKTDPCTLYYRNYKNVCIHSLTNSITNQLSDSQPNHNLFISNNLDIFNIYCIVRLYFELKKHD